MSDETMEEPGHTTQILAPTPNANPEASQSLNMSASVIEAMMERAHRYPRDLRLVQSKAYQELEIVPELAARSYYSIPYNQGKQNETRVEGPSIKAAMTLCRNWGNCFNQGRIAGEEKSNVITQGIFIDFETGVPTIREVRVSKFYKPARSQGVVPRNADALYNAVQAGISKSVRNAILATLPDWLVSGYFNHAKQLVINPPKAAGAVVVSLQERVVKGKQLLCKTFKITPDEMEAYLIENGDMFEDEGSLLIHLQGLYNAFKDNHASVDETFRPGKAKEQPGMPQEKK